MCVSTQLAAARQFGPLALCRREAKRFEELLHAADVRVVRRSYFDEERPSLTMHFEVIHAMNVQA